MLSLYFGLPAMDLSLHSQHMFLKESKRLEIIEERERGVPALIKERSAIPTLVPLFAKYTQPAPPVSVL